MSNFDSQVYRAKWKGDRSVTNDLLYDIKKNGEETNRVLNLMLEKMPDTKKLETLLSMIVDNTNCACEALKKLEIKPVEPPEPLERIIPVSETVCFKDAKNQNTGMSQTYYQKQTSLDAGVTWSNEGDIYPIDVENLEACPLPPPPQFEHGSVHVNAINSNYPQTYYGSNYPISEYPQLVLNIDPDLPGHCRRIIYSNYDYKGEVIYKGKTIPIVYDLNGNFEFSDKDDPTWKFSHSKSGNLEFTCNDTDHPALDFLVVFKQTISDLSFGIRYVRDAKITGPFLDVNVSNFYEEKTLAGNLWTGRFDLQLDVVDGNFLYSATSEFFNLTLEYDNGQKTTHNISLYVNEQGVLEHTPSRNTQGGTPRVNGSATIVAIYISETDRERLKSENGIVVRNLTIKNN